MENAETPPESTPERPWSRFRAELREAGENGKQQWEHILATWRAQLAERPQLSALVGQAREQLTTATNKVGEAATKLRQSPQVQQIESRGAEMLRQLAAKVREGASELEERLAPPAPPEAA